MLATQQQQGYFIDPATLPQGIRREQVEQLFEREQARVQARDEAILRALTDLRTAYHGSRSQLLSKADDRLLHEFMQQHRQPVPTDLAQPQQESTTTPTPQAKRLSRPGLPTPPVKNLDALKALHIETRKKFDAIIQRAVVVEDDSAPTAPAHAVTSSHRSTPVVYFPPYGWWDRNVFDAYDLATGAGRINRHESFLWADVGRTGSCLWGQNFNASGADMIQMVRGNGFFLGYTMPHNGVLRVVIDMECGWCEHCLQTWDEFGWSDYSGWTREVLSVGVLYNWSDPDLGAEVRDHMFVYGLRGSGDGETSPGVVYPVPAGRKRTSVKHTNVSLPAGMSVYVYVGTEQQAWAWLNDVSCNTFVNAAWWVKRISIQTV